MPSKAFHSFDSKMAYFNDDIELIDVLRTAVLDGDLTDPNTNRLLKHVDPNRHRHIARRQNSDGSRRNTINHLRASVYSSYLKDLYEEVTEYLRAILNQASLNGFNAGEIRGQVLPFASRWSKDKTLPQARAIGEEMRGQVLPFASRWSKDKTLPQARAIG